MAEALLGVVTEAVLTKLISLTNKGISGLMSSNEDLQRLTEQLEMIHALLSDADTKSTKKAVEIWLKRLENASINADNLLDEIAYHQVVKKISKENKTQVCNFLSPSNSLLFRLKMVSKIKRILLEIDEIYKIANNIGLRPIKTMNFPNDPRIEELTDPFVDISNIVGRDNDLRTVVSQLLTSEKKNLFVMGIIGMAGQGKTTLAKLLIKDDEIKNYFEKIIWTCVSYDFDVDRVLKDIIQSLTGEVSQLNNREAIVKRLSKELEGKRFLLVLDNVWNENIELWDCMKNSLLAIGGSKESKIVVTTRSDLVVTIMDGFHYHLGVLSEKYSRELFEKIAFGNGRVRKTPELVKIGERIVSRCGGVPLALTTIGGLMSSQRNENEWRKIEESNVWNLLDKVSSAIKLSFDHLPSLSIKQCFIYCSIFPKDSTLKKDDLIQQWMAHGLINPSRESDLEMEMVGNNYFKILLQRSFLQEDKCDDLFGNIISWKMHDLVHDFAFETSKGRCLIIAKVGQLNTHNITNLVHLSIICDESYYKTSSNISKIDFSRLRTLNLIGGNNSTPHFFNHCNCKNLRVLSIYDMGMNELPISIAKMKHLRYLDIFNTSIHGSLPKFVSKLYNMQTLKTRLIKRLPVNFVQLYNLRHLNIEDDYAKCQEDYFVPWVSKFNHLRTLNCFPVSRQNGCHIEELCNLNKLEGNLHIVGLENVVDQDDAKKANLSKKCYIDQLVLVWGINDNAQLSPSRNDQSVLDGLQPHPCLKALNIKHFMGKGLSSWILTLQNLMSLKLEGLGKCEEIPSLGHLPFLKFLEMIQLKSLKCITNDFYGWSNLVHPTDPPHHTYCQIFPSLVKLGVNGLNCLKEWSDMIIPPSFSSSSILAFPRLKEIEIISCHSLTYLPQVLFSASTSVKNLYISACLELIAIPNMSKFHTLEKLIIFHCPKLQVLPLGIDACISLKSMYITGPARVIKSLILPYLTNLKYLILFLSNNVVDPYKNYSTSPSSSSSKAKPYHSSSSNVEFLLLFGDLGYKFLPKQIMHFTSLRSLGILSFPNLRTIPEWFGKFQSLKALRLEECRLLASLPSEEVMSSLTHLEKLFIIRCPILVKRCKEETGREWHKIARIPQRVIRNQISYKPSDIISDENPLSLKNFMTGF